jgi:phage N-6-adenine-methyltransferase
MKTTLNVHTSSTSTEWATPQWLFNQLSSEFNFATDVCATPDKAKCAHFFTPEQDGLQQNWVGNCWMNPPYGREIAKWIGKAYESAVCGNATVVCLVPPSRSAIPQGASQIRKR